MKDERVWRATSGTYVTNPRAAMSTDPYRVFSEAYAEALVEVADESAVLVRAYASGDLDEQVRSHAILQDHLDRLDSAKAAAR